MRFWGVWNLKENPPTIFQQLLRRSSFRQHPKALGSIGVSKKCLQKREAPFGCLETGTYMPPPAEAASVTGRQSGTH